MNSLMVSPSNSRLEAGRALTPEAPPGEEGGVIGPELSVPVASAFNFRTSQILDLHQLRRQLQDEDDTLECSGIARGN